MDSAIFDKVNTFITRVRDCEIIISDKVNDSVFLNSAAPNDNKTLSEYLTDSIWKFEQGGLTGSTMEQAVECLHWINRAYFYGFTRENVGRLLSKMKDKNEIITKLQKELSETKAELQKVSTDLIFMEGKYDELNSKFDRMIPKGEIPK